VKSVIEDIINKLDKKFREHSPLGTSLGKTLEYLGMKLGYTTKGTVKISMYKFFDKMLTEMTSEVNGIAKTSVAGHLFHISPEAKKLPQERAGILHHLVAKLLYLCNVPM